MEQARISNQKKLNFDPSDDFILFSSVSKAGMDEAWDAILEKLWGKENGKNNSYRQSSKGYRTNMFKEKSLATFCLLAVKYLYLLKLEKS